MNKSQALHTFWNSFGLPAYDQYTVPDNAQMPYITYSVSETDFDYPVALTASLWYNSPSWEEISLKSHEISKYITLGGRIINVDGGKLWIYRRSPFSQRMSDVSDSVRRIVLSISVEFFMTD